MRIEKGVPIPTLRSNGITATLRKLKPGNATADDESVMIPSNKVKSWHAVAAQLGIKITVRLENDKHRLWRLT